MPSSPKVCFTAQPRTAISSITNLLAYISDVLPPVQFMFDRQFYLDPSTLDETLFDFESDPPALMPLTRPTDDPPYSDGQVPIEEVDGRLLPPALADFVREHYVLLEEVEFARVYRLAR